MRSVVHFILLANLASCGQSASIIGVAVSSGEESSDDGGSETNSSGTTETTTETGTISRAADGSFTLSLDLDKAENFICDGSSCALSNGIKFEGGSIGVSGVDVITDTAADWQAGTMQGVAITGNDITLNATNNLAWMCDESWTPRWAEMALCYSFEGSGTTVTNIKSPGTYDGTLVGATRTSTARAGSQAASFDGISAYVDTGYIKETTTTKAMTAMVWVKVPPSSNKMTVIGTDTTPAVYQFHLHINDFNSGVATAFFNSGLEAFNTVSTNTNLNDDNWHHIAVTLADNSLSGTVKLYVDGRQEAQSSLSGHDAIDLAPYTMFIGAANQQGTAGDLLAGIIDDVAIWTIDLTAAEVAKIYQRQRMAYSGTYTSQVFNLGTSADMTGISMAAPLPFGSALPGAAGNESSATYSELSNAAGETGQGSGLSSKLLTIYHFDDDSSVGVSDYSGHQKNSTSIIQNLSSSTETIEAVGASLSASESFVNAGVTSGEPGIIGKGFRFEGGAVRFPNPGQTDAISVSVWIKPNNQFTDGGNATVVGVGTDTSWDLQYDESTNRIRLSFHNGTSWQTPSVSSDIPQNQWTHIVAVYDRNLASPHYRVYLNGRLDVSTSDFDNSTIRTESATPMDVGARGNDLSRPFLGLIDELAIWSRGLAPEEVLEIFRRGTNQIKLQARVCADSACNTVSTSWFGGSGWSNFFSWWYNRTSIDSNGTATGSVLLAQPYFLLSKFPTNPAPGTYWQFRTILESRVPFAACSDGAATCYPALSSVGLHAPNHQGTTTTSFTNNPAIPYNTLTAIFIEDIGTCSYQFAPQGDGNYYYHDGSNWTVATTDSQSNKSFDLGLASITGWPAGSQLIIKAIVGGEAPCTIRSIRVDGT